MTNSNKTFVISMILALVMVGQIKAFTRYNFIRLNSCYHYRYCIAFANSMWLAYAQRVPMWYRAIFAHYISRILRWKMRSFHIYPPQNTMNPFIPLLAYKRIEPTYGYKNKFGRQLEEVHGDQSRMLEGVEIGEMPEDEKTIMKDKIEAMTSLSEIKENICEAVNNDSEIFKGSHILVKTWYQLYARVQYFKEHNELRPVEFFDMSCFVNPHNEIKDDLQNLSNSQILSLSEDEQYVQSLTMTEFDLMEVSHEQDFKGVTELTDDGSRWDNSSSTNFPTQTEEDHVISEKELIALSENAF